MDETESGNRKLKQKAEAEKLKFGNWSSEIKPIYQDIVHIGVVSVS